MKEPSPRRRCAVTIAAALVTACASPTPQRSSEWIDPALGPGSGILRGQKVLATCEAWDLSLRQNCQTSLYLQLQARGADPVTPSGPAATANGPQLDSLLMQDAATAGARTVLVVTLTPTLAPSAFSGASIGIGGFSWGHGGGAGIGLSTPIGGSGWGSTGFAAQARVTDLANGGRLVWSTTFVSPESADPMAQVRALTSAVLDAARGSGLL